MSAQAANGAFGYPYEPNGPGLRQQAAQRAEGGEKQGLKMVERGWVIEDLGSGGLNFDNGVCGAVLLQGYALTGDRRDLDSAVRAGQWAKSRPLALKFNYNGFSGLLLARLYRVTGDHAWLDAAKDIFEFGVLSGQMPNGRWFDQHNAKIQYHAILCSQVTEYLLALRQAKDATAAHVEKQLRRALDNLAGELTTYGTNNAGEALSLSKRSSPAPSPSAPIRFGTARSMSRSTTSPVPHSRPNSPHAPFHSPSRSRRGFSTVRGATAASLPPNFRRGWSRRPPPVP